VGDIHTLDHNMFLLSGLVGRFLSLEVFFPFYFFYFFSFRFLGFSLRFSFLREIIRLWVILSGAWLGVEVVSYTRAGCILCMRTYAQAGIIQVEGKG